MGGITIDHRRSSSPGGSGSMAWRERERERERERHMEKRGRIMPVDGVHRE